jgi:acetyl-CoA carboxylase biotin carboxyl carrier protein
MRLVEQSGFDELNLEIDGVKLQLRRGGAVERSAVVEPSAVSAAPTQTATRAAVTPAPANDPNVQDVPSPLLGTFYRSPKPGAPPFVEVGAEVEENTVVAIIEVMKLMNTVRAGVRGTVTEILLADGALAEYAQPLLRVRKAG